jgi:riboflavin kinase
VAEKVRNAGTKLADNVGSLINGSDNDSHSEDEETKEGRRRGLVYPMVMSVGWNPYYKNTVRSVVCIMQIQDWHRLTQRIIQEVHIMHSFQHDFYGRHLNLAILGFIRPEYDYVSKDSLIDDIKTDIEVARRSLARPAYAKLKRDKYLSTFPSRSRSEKDGLASL